MQSKGYLFLVIVLALAVLSGFLFTQREAQYGLDIKGGVRLTYRMKTEELKPDQKSNLADIRSNLIDILGKRVSASLGVVEGNVQAKGTEEFIIELPGFTDVKRARETMSSTASIKCYHAKNVVTDRSQYRQYDQAGEESLGGTPIVTFRERNKDEVFKPGDPQYKRMIEGWDLILEGSDLARAYPEMQGSNAVPHFEFSNSGAQKLERWCRRFMNRGEKIAFVLDGQVLSIAPVKDNTILSRSAFIDGQFTQAYVKSLTDLLNAGALPVSLEETSNQTVDPTIGQFAYDAMLKAGMISFGLIVLFLIAYYAFPGFVAFLALLLYVLFTLTAMKLMGATFSLAAIAGFILSVGMAVDANILVFERTKEEMREGRTLLQAVELGFKRALPAIVDSNACTILTSLVLVNLGTGPVKGFASTLIVGVAISLFTAVTVTRSLLVFLVGSGMVTNPKWFALGRQWFGESLEKEAHIKPLQVVNRSKLFFGISIATIIPGLIAMGMGGLKPNVEFQGGFEATYPMSPSLTSDQIVRNLEQAGFKGSNVKITTEASGNRLVSVTVPPSQNLRTDDPAAYSKIAQSAGGLELSERPSLTSIGPTIQAETVRNAIVAVIISSLLIVLYLTIRFGLALGGARNGIKFGLSAIGALVHDIFVVLGVAAIIGLLAGWEISAMFLTAMLTVIGFSVHDSIVIFDRIRENLRKPVRGENFENLCNRSITQSFARSINTSMTVIATLVILIVWGTPSIDLKFFCVAMLVGIISGTYSSIYNAAPILYLWDKAVERRKGPEHTLVAEATAEVNRLRAAAMAADTGPATLTPVGPSSAAQRGYGTIKRRSGAIDKSKREVDDEE